MNTLFRCTIHWTGPYQATRPSNIFMQAPNKEAAEAYALKSMMELCEKSNIPDPVFKIDTTVCSEDEMRAYFDARKAGHRTVFSLN